MLCKAFYWITILPHDIHYQWYVIECISLCTRGADKSLAHPTSICPRTKSIVSLEANVLLRSNYYRNDLPRELRVIPSSRPARRTICMSYPMPMLDTVTGRRHSLTRKILLNACICMPYGKVTELILRSIPYRCVISVQQHNSSVVVRWGKKVKEKVKWSSYRPGVAQKVGRGIALLFHDRGTRRGWVVSSTPRPHFTPGKDPVTILEEAGWAPGPVWIDGKSRPRRDSIPDHPAHSQSLYRLSYAAHW